MPTYQPNIPTGTVPFLSDYLNLQGNFQQLNIAYEVDHVPLTDTSGVPPGGISGMHEAIHLVPVSTTTSNPPNNQPINGYTATPGYGQIFDAQINDSIGTDTALYFLSGGNKLTQLTRNFQPVAAANGYTFLPGGLILQWGKINGSHSGKFSSGDNSTVTFSSSNIAFPNNCFIVLANPLYTTTVPSNTGGFANVAIDTALLTKTGFKWTFITNSSDWTQFQWIAIGN